MNAKRSSGQGGWDPNHWGHYVDSVQIVHLIRDLALLVGGRNDPQSVLLVSCAPFLHSLTAFLVHLFCKTLASESFPPWASPLRIERHQEESVILVPLLSPGLPPSAPCLPIANPSS